MSHETRVLRRLQYIDDLVENRLDKYKDLIDSYSAIGLCELTSKQLIDMVTEWVTENMYYNHFSDVDDLSDEWVKMYTIMHKYIESVHSNRIVDYFKELCDN